jgi:hypothetical protein
MISPRVQSQTPHCIFCNPAKIAYGSAAIIIYIQSLFWLVFSLHTTPTNCTNMTTPCNDYPEEFCGIECPTFTVFMVLVFGNMLASLPGLLLSIQGENRDKTDFSYDSKISLRCYSVAGIVTTSIEIHYLKALFPLVTGILYVYAVTITREFWWRKNTPVITV